VVKLEDTTDLVTGHGEVFVKIHSVGASSPSWQGWMREEQPRLIVIWGKYDLSFDLSEPEAYRRDVPNTQIHVLDAGHFALDTAADEVAALVRGFVGSSR
jgi:pimeloyl-ACP methyl ester carboxylesterase